MLLGAVAVLAEEEIPGLQVHRSPEFLRLLLTRLFLSLALTADVNPDAVRATARRCTSLHASRKTWSKRL
ncbi:hypothetical protein RRG08_034950 [Elysia crispata]|uniref:Uncharacterized protein n=1 Tax=Elysia crispata TaxID=231223 RepID=A0AAE1CRE4_9GAST|nr:hypothetical protein RRG08_034950 [Elysia crispata]